VVEVVAIGGAADGSGDDDEPGFSSTVTMGIDDAMIEQ
jgi:hypothetical protein